MSEYLNYSTAFLCFWDGENEDSTKYVPVSWILYNGRPKDSEGVPMGLKDGGFFIKLSSGEMTPINMLLADIQ
jgi:hypothetical protein